ncbi:hypothetical protein PSACC_03107 [Paramicrosporidium saccamoebae]|uniref:Histone-lysine N-methyltransferase, H3 lysine-4 specific n=1 Tax=Paramicrosporidium saccamoebae TaxID=1246581 RepID=A0A2H9TH29_9FUNG|nr:hypothetical protein PSACC_03107 [Paramicrosporidium saccamoebae]
MTYDPALHGLIKEKPTYLMGNAIIEGISVDPRSKGFESVPATLKPITFQWDENSKNAPPPSTVLVSGFPSKVISKALLISLIGAALDKEIADQIKDVQLFNGSALLTMEGPAASSQLVRRLCKNGDSWTAVFDADGEKFQKLCRPKPEPQLTPRAADGGIERLKCSRRVPCILIDFSTIPRDVSRRDIERGEAHWHVHLSSQDEVEYSLRWKNDFRWNARSISFTTKSHHEPAKSCDFRDDHILCRSDIHRKTLQDLDGHRKTSQDTDDHRKKSQDADEHRRTSQDMDERKPSATQKELRGNLDAFYRPASQTSSLEIVSTLQSAESVSAEESLLSMPIFNKRHLERKRHEEEAALQVAEEARLQLEQKIAEEEQRRIRKEERKVRKVGVVSKPEAVPSVDTDLRIHKSGSARTEGFYRPVERIVYLENIASQAKPVYDSAEQSSGGSRSNRAQNRRLVSSMDHLSSDLFVKTSAFSVRRKKLVLGRSSIHSWGLFAGEEIETGNMVSEYVGEVIRFTVANIRERRYEMLLRAKGSTDMASSYFFRLDDTLVVDATHKGNLSRFINHSCDPTCVARVIAIDGKQRIVFYARRDIRLGEEITYDYKFPLEDDPEKKIKCLCGTRTCRGTLN